jgi:adenylate cyclase
LVRAGMKDVLGRVRAGLPAAAAGAFMLGIVVVFWALDVMGLPGIARERAFDLLYVAFPRPSNARVIAVDIDRRTLQALGDWPIPRTEMAELIARIAAAGAKAIALDIFLSGPDRRSSHTLADEVSRLAGGEEYAQSIRQLPDSDAAFADILARTPTVLGALGAASSAAFAVNLIRVDGALDAGTVTLTDGFTPPYEPLANAALAIGIQSLFGEEGARVRRVPLLLLGNGILAPGLALETARIGTGAAIITVAPQAGSLSFGDGSASIAESGQMRIHWSDPGRWPLRTVSAIDILDGTADASRLSDAAIVIGSSVPEAGSLRPTAASPLTPSLQIEAEAIDQLLEGGAPVRPASAAGLELSAMVLIGFIAICIGAWLGPVPAVLGIAALVALWFGICLKAFFAGSLIDPVGSPAAILIGSNAAAGAAFARTLRLKTLISRRFAQYLALEVVNEIIARPDRLKRAGEMREVTALFTDVEGFTAMTHRVAPTVLIALLDRYFDGLCRTALANGGMIDAIAGDALHVFFNVPLEQNEHVDAALDCALAIQDFAETFRQTADARAAGFGRTRIGVESGPAIVGDVGGSRRLNYTAHGDAINRTARLEAANKEFGSAICIGPGAAAAARRTKLRPLGSLTLRGFDQPVTVYTPDQNAVSSPTPEPPRSSGRPIA